MNTPAKTLAVPPSDLWTDIAFFRKVADAGIEFAHASLHMILGRSCKEGRKQGAGKNHDKPSLDQRLSGLAKDDFRGLNPHERGAMFDLLLAVDPWPKCWTRLFERLEEADDLTRKIRSDAHRLPRPDGRRWLTYHQHINASDMRDMVWAGRWQVFKAVTRNAGSWSERAAGLGADASKGVWGLVAAAVDVRRRACELGWCRDGMVLCSEHHPMHRISWDTEDGSHSIDEDRCLLVL